MVLKSGLWLFGLIIYIGFVGVMVRFVKDGAQVTSHRSKGGGQVGVMFCVTMATVEMQLFHSYLCNSSGFPHETNVVPKSSLSAQMNERNNIFS